MVFKGGHPAESDRFPYILSLRAPIAKGGVSRLHCGAVLIDRHWALTAASCVERRLKGVPNPPIYGGSTSRDGPFPEVSYGRNTSFRISFYLRTFARATKLVAALTIRH